tara:strand:- start:750 stop:1064 length:315 start_codon:yes stop_codon:yes gene_type:complete
MALFRHVLHGSFGWKGSAIQLIKDSFALLAKPMFLLGLVVFASSTFLWLFVLATQKLSLAYPVQIGLVLVFTGLVSMLVFSETISPQGYVGYALLIIGVFLVTR